VQVSNPDVSNSNVQNSNVDLVIFDCDGVLVDSEVISCRAHASMLTGNGYPITADQVLDRFLGVSDREARMIVEAELGRSLPIDFEARMKQAAVQRYADDLLMIPHVGAAIGAIDLPKCVASSGTPDKIRHLKPGGMLLAADSVSPENPALDTFLNCIELLRDASHVRDYSWSEWQNFLESAGFESDYLQLFPVFLDGGEWVKRIQTPAAKVEILHQLFSEANETTRAAFDLRDDPWSWTIPIALMRGKKRK